MGDGRWESQQKRRGPGEGFPGPRFTIHPNGEHYSRVTQAVRQMRVAPKGWLRQIRRRLERLAEDDE